MITSPLMSISITSVLASSWDGDYLAGGGRAGVDPATHFSDEREIEVLESKPPTVAIRFADPN